MVDVLNENGGHTLDLRPILLCVSLVGLNVTSYLVWPSRWNILAHAQLAFGFVAYVVPILFLHVLDRFSDDALSLYFQVTVFGFVACLVGTAFGGWLGSLKGVLRTSRKLLPTSYAQLVLPRRIRTVAWLAVLAMLVSFIVMGFIPALAADPFSAKFFKGAYGTAYKPVAPLYRTATTALALFMPLVAMYAWKVRSVANTLLLIATVSVMLLSLQREPAVSGVLLFLGALLAVRGSRMIWYFAILLGVYFVGSAIYFVLASLGVEAFAQGASVSTSWLQEVAAGSPDVSDQLNLLTMWIQHPSYTHGLTFLGGLVPGNFKWNPSIWTLQVLNPGANVSDIQSGGLRLPAPMWGLVSFGEPGVIAVSLVNGLFTGLFAQVAKHLIPGRPLVDVTVLFVLYAAMNDVFPVFFRLSYLSIMELAFVLLVAYWRARPSDPRALKLPARARNNLPR